MKEIIDKSTGAILYKKDPNSLEHKVHKLEKRVTKLENQVKELLEELKNKS